MNAAPTTYGIAPERQRLLRVGERPAGTRPLDGHRDGIAPRNRRACRDCGENQRFSYVHLSHSY